MARKERVFQQWAPAPQNVCHYSMLKQIDTGLLCVWFFLCVCVFYYYYFYFLHFIPLALHYACLMVTLLLETWISQWMDKLNTCKVVTMCLEKGRTQGEHRQAAEPGWPSGRTWSVKSQGLHNTSSSSVAEDPGANRWRTQSGTNWSLSIGQRIRQTRPENKQEIKGRGKSGNKESGKYMMHSGTMAGKVDQWQDNLTASEVGRALVYPMATGSMAKYSAETPWGAPTASM